LFFSVAPATPFLVRISYLLPWGLPPYCLPVFHSWAGFFPLPRFRPFLFLCASGKKNFSVLLVSAFGLQFKIPFLLVVRFLPYTLAHPPRRKRRGLTVVARLLLEAYTVLFSRCSWCARLFPCRSFLSYFDLHPFLSELSEVDCCLFLTLRWRALFHPPRCF